MMKKLFLILFIISPYLLFGQSTTEESLYLFVSASSGLRGREAPNLNSKVLKAEPYGECMYFHKRKTNKDTINGITDYWYCSQTRLDDNSLIDIWFFGGYLTKYFENDLFIGRWLSIEDNKTNYIFSLTNKVEYNKYEKLDLESEVLYLYKETYYGTYKKTNNSLTINFNILQFLTKKQDGLFEYENINETRKARINIIDTNTMQLIFDNGETVNLKRNNE
jgi:hypothetical protein